MADQLTSYPPTGLPTRMRNRERPTFAGLNKLQPQAPDLEMAVLGALMLEKDALSKVIDILKPELFYEKKNALIFEAVRSLFDNSEAVDILTVSERLKKNGHFETVGGGYYITELTSMVASAANIEFHARIISQKYIQRQLIKICGEVSNEAYEDATDVFDLLDDAEQQLFALSENSMRRDSVPVNDLVLKTIKNLEELRNKQGGITGIPTGFRDLDELTSGWQPSDLIIVAARPGMGKTAFALSLSLNAAIKNNVPVAFFSLEMSAVQIAKRLLSCETEIELQDLMRGKLEDHQFAQLGRKSAALSQASLHINDTPALSIYDLRAKCRRLKKEKNIQLVIIDYLQLMSGGNSKAGNREQEIAGISRALKELAKELDVAVIALSQLSRMVETRGGDKRPMLSDLRESGSIEQDADLVCFLYNPSYYGIETFDDNTDARGLCEVIVAKHRNGRTDKVRLNYLSKYTKFTDPFGADAYGGGNFKPYKPVSAGYNSGTDMPSLNSGPQFRTFPSKMNDDDIEDSFTLGPISDNPF